MTITNEKEYQAALLEFEELAQVDQTVHYDRLIVLRDTIDAYEKAQGWEPGMPTTLAGRLELEMFRLRLNQKGLAALIGVSPTRLNEVLNGKRQPNLDLVKRLHHTLHIPAEELLEMV